MTDSPLKNTRVIAFLLLFTAFVVFVCFLLYTYGSPKFEAAATATREKNTQVAETMAQENSVVTQQAEQTLESLYQTQTAVPTATQTPTATLTLTATPVLENCVLTVRSGALFYQGPSVGFASALVKATTLPILAEAENIGWYKSAENQDGYTWVQKKDMVGGDCTPKAAALSYLMGWDTGNSVLLEENFSKINEWVYKPDDEPINPIMPSGQEYQVLEIGKARQSTQVSLRKPFGYLPNFSIYTSFVWELNGDFGIRFWDDGVSYYEVVITPTCMMQIYDTEKLLIERQIVTEKSCFHTDDSDNVNYFQVSVIDSTLSLKVNEAAPISYTLESPYIGESITVVTKNSTVDIEYFVLTSASR